MLAAVVAGLCFVGLDLVGRNLMDRYLTSEDFVHQKDQQYLDDLRDYIRAESVTAWDADKLTEWVYQQAVVSIQVVRDGMVTYDSFYPEADYVAYPAAGQHYEWGDYHTIMFADGPAVVWLYGYYYYQYDVRLLVLSLAGAFLVFLGIVMAGLQGTITYIRQLSREIGVLEGGTLDVPITIRGRDELTDLAQGLDAMRDSFLRQTMRERQLVQASRRQSAGAPTALTQYLDVLIPRGGAGLIRSVKENAKVPVIETGVGNCHAYVDASADLRMAAEVVYNGKCSRPSVCNALETLLVHKDIAEQALPLMQSRLSEKQVELRGCERTRAILPGITPATEEDWETEYGDYILAVKVVDSLEEALAHIAKYSSGHSEVILTQNYQAAQRFLEEVDAAAVYVNASTRFTDGGEFGLGAEIGISTQKLHARGPMGLGQLTSTKFLIRGSGQVR